MSKTKNKKNKSIKIDENLLNEILTSEQKINTSIYKIDDSIKTEHELLEKIKEKIKPKPSLQCKELNKYNFKGFLFSYKTSPDWINLIMDLLIDDFSKNESDENINKNESKSNEEIDDNETFELYNSNISYILIKTLLVEDTDKKAKGITLLKMNMYAITGGRGYLIISEFIEKNFGLNLVPRLIKTEDKIIRKVVEDRLMGNRIYTSRRNKSNTDLNFETDFSNVYRELEFSADEDILLN